MGRGYQRQIAFEQAAAGLVLIDQLDDQQQQQAGIRAQQGIEW